VDQPGSDQQTTKKICSIGHEALLKKDKASSVVYPIKRGTIPNYEDSVCIWEHILFKELGAYKMQYQVLLSENPINKKQDRSKLAEIFFEKLAAESIAIMNGACLSLFSTGKTKGLVVEIGEGAAHTVPIFEGFALQHAALTNDIAGQDITGTLIDGLASQGMRISHKMGECGRDIKEKMCSVPLDYAAAVCHSHAFYIDCCTRSSYRRTAFLRAP